MILNALAELYEDLAANPESKIPRPGWGKSNVSFALSLSPEGELLQIVSVMTDPSAGKKTVLRPRVMEVPEPVKRSSGVAANFLCDNSAYMLGLDSKGKPERALQCFEQNKELHQRLLSSVDAPMARAILGFFEKWDPAQAETHPLVEPYTKELKGGANLVFRMEGRFAHTEPLIGQAWQRAYDQTGEDEEMGLCLASGKRAPLTRLHPSIKGVRNAQAMGASLVSFNAEAYDSYGKRYGANAPVSKQIAFAYGTALNHLLTDREHVQQLGDATVVFWAKGGQTAPQDLFAAMQGDVQGKEESELKSAMERLAQGKTIQWGTEEVDPKTPFYVLGLSPNAARLSVRFFLRDSFGMFADRMLQHQRRLEIVRPSFDGREQLGFWSLLRETVNMNSRDKSPAPIMAGETLRAILTGGRYPATLLNGVMLRIRAEGEVSRGRAAIIKAYYLKNTHKDCPKEVLTVELNDSANIPYRLGRTFSILEAIQQAANPGINATIKDKYFNSASATPAMVFPTLVNLAQKHLRKLEGGLKVHYEKQLTELLGILQESYPTRLSLPQQGSFQLGYYHQTQKRYEKKKEEPAHV